MSELNDAERETIREHSGEWVLGHIDELASQLATERAKVADLESRLMAEGERHMNAVCRFHDEKERATGIEDNLAAERAKVALAVRALKPLTAEVAGMIGIEEQAFRDLLGNTNVNCLKQRWLDARSTLETLQSSDALAEIRREVARECAEILKGVEDRYSKHSFPMHPADVAAACVYVIRANFGVTE